MINRTTHPSIQSLKADERFVFGSNAEGKHFGGAAALAHERFGAIWGQPLGFQGQSYGINTMDDLTEIKVGVSLLIGDAIRYPQLKFLVTEIGCGIAGYTPFQIAPLFKEAVNINNIYLPESFWAILNQNN